MTTYMQNAQSVRKRPDHHAVWMERNNPQDTMRYSGRKLRYKLKVMIAFILTAFATAYLHVLWYPDGLFSASRRANPWDAVPDFEVLVRMNTDQVENYYDCLTTSMHLFWPRHVKVIVVMDNETYSDHTNGNRLRKTWPYPYVMYERPQPEIYRNDEKTRQRRSMLYADKYIISEYVAFVETDTMFITTVTPESLFENGKPIVIGLIGKYVYPEREAAAAAVTKTLFGSEQVMQCRGYFPVMIKVQHIHDLRNYLAKTHGMDFDELIRTKMASTYSFSPFNIMCQYIFLFHRHEYRFYLQMRPDDQWEQTSEYRIPLEFYQENFKPEERKPFPRISIHYRHHKPQEEMVSLTFGIYRYLPQALLEGVCHSGGFDLCPRECKLFSRSDLHNNLFNFDQSLWSWDSRCFEAQRTHYANVHKLNNYYLNTTGLLFGQIIHRVACALLKKPLNN